MDHDALSTMRISSPGLLPTGALLDSLVHISNEVVSIDKLPHVHMRNVSSMIRRIKLLSSLFEEIQETETPLPPSSVLCFTEIFSVITRVKVLIRECKDRSTLWGLMQLEPISNQFYVLVKEMGRALDILPLKLLHITEDIREQVELLQKQSKRVESMIDPKEIQRRELLLQVMASKGLMDFGKIGEILSSTGLRTPSDYDGEVSKLEDEAQNQAGTGGLVAVSNINNLISLVSYSKSMIFRDEEDCSKQPSSSSHNKFNDSCSSSTSIPMVTPNVPDEFRCPISLDLTRDPVIVSSGHTYDRNSIAQWINSGHHTCPKSGQRLIHTALIPNYALKSLIQQWCYENNVPASEPDSSPSEGNKARKNRKESAVDHISANKAASDAVKMTAEFLVGKLATGSPDTQRQAAYELRLLAKTGMDNRRIIAEVGALPFLVTLLGSRDPRIQEHAVTALFNLSIYDNNKTLIMSAAALDSIVDVLESGRTTEARENAAAALYSLSMLDECKLQIGASPRAIPALVGLLKQGTPIGKRDAAAALFNLAVYNPNKKSVVDAGAVDVLVELLMDDKAAVTDDALAVLALLLGCSQGRQEIRNSKKLVPLLIDLLRFGSVKGKENSITLLLGLCKEETELVARRLLANPRSVPALQSLAAHGSLRARRKADALLRLLHRCCSQPIHSL